MLDPRVRPLESFGRCEVAACPRGRIGNRNPYCEAHCQRLKLDRERSADGAFDEELWRRTTPAVAENADVSLGGLAPRVVAEVLYGLQERTNAEIQTRHYQLRPFCDLLRYRQLGSIEDLAEDGLGHLQRGLRNGLLKPILLSRLNPETERHKDVWNAVVFGHSGSLRFTEISQPWLREAAKAWSFNALPKRRGDGATGVIQTHVNSLARLSESLRLQRADHGDDVTAVTRDDITAFLNRLAYLHSQGTLGTKNRHETCRSLKRVLTQMRAIGLTHRGRPLHGLAEEFALGPADMPEEPEDSEAGRDLPAEVMRVLCAHLDWLDRSTREVRVAVELLIDTGRRPDEICQLALDCLERDADGKPVLIYDNHKAQRQGRRLPIPEATAALIVRQQEAVRVRFPDTPAGELKLLPSPIANPFGRKAITDGWVSDRHREWVAKLPDILVSVNVEEGGKRVTKMLPFDKKRLFPYAYRHTYAQRHADAGVAVDVLRELMDHRQLDTTQGYYRVGESRRRDAVERVTTMQFDRHGNRTWRQAQVVLDSERLRRAVGEVAVPYGSCSEPSNVAAAGQDCPVRFRCVDCGHFSTDISYLPDLERYLADLLRHRERLAATIDADQWAKNEAMPSDEEITRIRRLISRMKGDLDELTEEERTQITDAVAVVRRSRAKIVGLGIPKVRQPLPDVRPERSA